MVALNFFVLLEWSLSMKIIAAEKIAGLRKLQLKRKEMKRKDFLT
jgi:hypothetical protein